VDGVAYVISAAGKRLGILTDLGHPFPGLVETIAGLDAAFLESNYDPGLLRNGPYPADLKERIAGPGGHLSNPECATLAREAASGGRLRRLVLAHLSGENNAPELALETAAGLADRGVRVDLAGRDAASTEVVLSD
jgi:phosphoribosyl 1,2-cyclic phosphodiesterase